VYERRSKSRTQKERKMTAQSPIKKTLNAQSFKLSKNPNNYSRSQISNSTAVGTVANATFANIKSVRSKKRERDDDRYTEPDLFEREADSEVRRSDLTGLTDIIVNDSLKLDRQMDNIMKDKKRIQTPQVQGLKNQSLASKNVIN
jgi:predicted  nucleic acid-binding Zn-ribbon protein